MVNCAVVMCQRRSVTSNLRDHGVSYHMFPKDVSLKKQWTQFCCKGKNWIPSRTSVICSEHFTLESFQELPNKRRKLVDDAIPTIKICPHMKECNHPNNIGHGVILNINTLKTSDIDPLQIGESPKNLNTLKTSDPDLLQIGEPPKFLLDNPQVRKMRSQLQYKNKKIRRLQAKTRYLKSKINNLEELLINLKDKSVIGKKQCNCKK